MKNRKAERIKASATFLKTKSKDYGQAMNVYCQDHSSKIIKEIGSLNRSLLNFTELNQLIKLICMYRQLDGYYHDMSDQKLDRLETKLHGLMADSKITAHERKRNDS
jgi:hypothetical protein